MNPMYAASIGALVYGLIALIGGLIGYMNKGSKPSLIAGGISGVLLLVCHFGIHHGQTWGLVGALIISLLLVGRFTSSLAKQSRTGGSLFATVIGKVSMIMVVAGVIEIILALWALLQ
ncbi:MAG TPA: TMEM14 family protein [Gemmataceae bacterium]|jgi:uncharacterized membrane protein (UPF0136 family)|nr:TMEM14 family protein [Gemmataceae bacterium]